ncbi:hypothetical protein H9Q69_012361 [Fusarium xylarioides]|uniref:Uncharacterized protein n=1 Tax=Fusarium xylarioides TaxID=221167 RepID=A0A9P7LQ32_9HYPO|nr:hypothetical protein H9Q72_008990 [Fusarium xylarioides]KAG5788570.1 hypothetical protein H9Q69_012361 [Fusarium xylarioides]KAG5817393.1 hypothetical protein H9Q74_010593 [Fusarium xylarioides]KAG5821116.1 hypothetical protein H9Q71_000301 [Fusarium xylarioides]
MADNSDHRIKINPLMPPAKQERIHIWRTEVASALHLPTAPSLSSSLSSSSAATPDPDPDTSFATPPSPAGSKPRSLWKRISWRFGPKRRTAANMAAAAAELPPDGRTAMYRGLENRVARGEDVRDEEGGILERDSEEGNGLKEKQERLARAARLLNRRTEER